MVRSGVGPYARVRAPARQIVSAKAFAPASAHAKTSTEMAALVKRRVEAGRARGRLHRLLRHHHLLRIQRLLRLHRLLRKRRGAAAEKGNAPTWPRITAQTRRAATTTPS
jgi:hypothetical protein